MPVNIAFPTHPTKEPIQVQKPPGTFTVSKPQVEPYSLSRRRLDYRSFAISTIVVFLKDLVEILTTIILTT